MRNPAENHLTENESTRGGDERRTLADGQVWARANELFLALVGRPEHEQVAHLASVSEAPSVVEEVRQLLALGTGPLAEIERALGVQDEVASFEPGDRLGPYLLEEVVGRGGTGLVVRATRSDGAYSERVAIKVIQQGMASAEVVARLRRERQLLAALRHPHIAALLDGGTTQDGRPFIVMEYIEGERLDRYCESARLTIKDRLRLFLEICEAVAFAHRNLVVHRDLKPSNILVDGEGRPKLLDFGIAKLLSAEADITLTRHGRQPLTPQYASPEQVCGQVITTACDVYGLGLVLYELVSGRRPYVINPQDGEAEIRKVICEFEPLPPSAVALRTSRLRDGLTRDLDHVVLMAISKAPVARYDSVDALAADVRRLLDGRSVQARGRSFFYRTTRFLLRHRAQAVVGLIALVLVSAFLAQRELQLRSLVRERARTERVKGMAMELLRTLRLHPRREERSVAIGFLDRSAAELEVVSPEPEDRILVAELLANGYIELGELGKAEVMLVRASVLRVELYGRISAEGQRGLEKLALLRADAGQAEVALVQLEEVVLAKRRLFGDEHPALAETLNGLGAVLWDLGRYAEAEERYRSALRMIERAHGTSDPELAEVESNLGLLLSTTGRLREAHGLLVHALATAQRTLPDEDAQVQAHRVVLGDILRGLGDFDGAIALHEQALSLYVERDGGDGRRSLPAAEVLLRLARTRIAMGEYDDAEQLALQALELDPDVRHNHRIQAHGQSVLGRIYLDQGRLSDARAQLRSARYFFEHTPERGNWRTAENESLLGAVELELGDCARAHRLMTSAHRTILAQTGPGSLATRDSEARLARFTDRIREEPPPCSQVASIDPHRLEGLGQTSPREAPSALHRRSR